MYAKHSNLVDADASGAKACTEHLDSRLEVIQGHAFDLGITEKPTRDYVFLLYRPTIMWAFRNFDRKV